MNWEWEQADICDHCTLSWKRKIISFLHVFWRQISVSVGCQGMDTQLHCSLFDYAMTDIYIMSFSWHVCVRQLSWLYVDVKGDTVGGCTIFSEVWTCNSSFSFSWSLPPNTDDLQFPRGIRQGWGGKWERGEQGYSSVGWCVWLECEWAWHWVWEMRMFHTMTTNVPIHYCSTSSISLASARLCAGNVYLPDASSAFTSAGLPAQMCLQCDRWAPQSVQPELSNMLTLTWQGCMFEWPGCVYCTAHFGCESCCLVAKAKQQLGVCRRRGSHLTFLV